ncbi:molybdopterin-dependent oxidoreductase [Alicyclobacillus sp.]|uniref:molybdopterin-dependent oxidoreductase n=1 Tax=Alicyclobacillus sp. TaxID=61169 RepID=UPI0025BB40E8|nr:molybdopterin-dependent oxidoreductase [Alicyclobacillus sp.]MCL6516813.1 molybdopterin-dependent oxidoreductase [Alicyclobacillus sp.]
MPSAPSRETAFRRLRTHLGWVHWAHVFLVLQLWITGLMLYVPAWRTRLVAHRMAIRAWHQWAGWVWVALLLAHAPLVVRYASALARRPAVRRWIARGHIAWLYAACLLWAGSGALMAETRHASLAWRAIATQVHDVLSALLLPWAALHIGGTWIRRRRYRMNVRQTTGAGPSPSMGLVPTAEPGPAISTLPATSSIISRRQFLLYGTATLAGLAVAATLRWIGVRGTVPASAPASATAHRRGQFRLYNVAEKTPDIRPGQYTLAVQGLVRHPVTFTMADLAALPQVSVTRDFYCVTGWAVTHVTWTGVPIAEILRQVEPLPEARFLTVHSLDGVYVDSYTLEQISRSDVLLAFELDGAPLPPAQGGPCRIILPQLYGYKSVKWVGRMVFTEDREVGYWEQRGYDLDGELPPK